MEIAMAVPDPPIPHSPVKQFPVTGQMVAAMPVQVSDRPLVEHTWAKVEQIRRVAGYDLGQRVMATSVADDRSMLMEAGDVARQLLHHRHVKPILSG
jgi:hypothetical protein